MLELLAVRRLRSGRRRREPRCWRTSSPQVRVGGDRWHAAVPKGERHALPRPASLASPRVTPPIRRTERRPDGPASTRPVRASPSRSSGRRDRRRTARGIGPVPSGSRSVHGPCRAGPRHVRPEQGFPLRLEIQGVGRAAGVPDRGGRADCHGRDRYGKRPRHRDNHRTSQLTHVRGLVLRSGRFAFGLKLSAERTAIGHVRNEQGDTQSRSYQSIDTRSGLVLRSGRFGLKLSAERTAIGHVATQGDTQVAKTQHSGFWPSASAPALSTCLRTRPPCRNTALWRRMTSNASTDEDGGRTSRALQYSSAHFAVWAEFAHFSRANVGGGARWLQRLGVRFRPLPESTRICPTVSSRMRLRKPFSSRLIRGGSRGVPHGSDDRATSPGGWQRPLGGQVR